MLAKTYPNSPEPYTLAILSSWKNILKSGNPRKYVFTTEYPQKNETLKAVAAFGASFFMPIYKSDSFFIEMTPHVYISDVIKACFDIINAGGNQASNA